MIIPTYKKRCHYYLCENIVIRKDKIFCSSKCFCDSIRGKKRIIRKCQECNGVIKSKGTHKKFCSFSCNIEYKKRNTHLMKNIFQKGNTPWNKGLKGLKPTVFCEIGETRIRAKRNEEGQKINPRRFIKTEDGWVRYASYSWKKNNGEIPKGQIVWFKDGDSLNDLEESNLYLIDKKDFYSITKKQS